MSDFVKTKRSKVLAIHIEEKEKSLKEKAQPESFYTKDVVFFSYVLNFNFDLSTTSRLAWVMSG